MGIFVDRDVYLRVMWFGAEDCRREDGRMNALLNAGRQVPAGISARRRPVALAGMGAEILSRPIIGEAWGRPPLRGTPRRQHVSVAYTN